MALYALDNVDDAIDVTRSFLTPIDAWRWAKLALVVLFVGGATGTNPLQFTFGGTGDGGEVPGEIPGFDADPGLWVLIGAGVLAILALALVFALIGSIMEFVFVEALRSDEVTVRRYWRRRWRQGLRLFGFRLVLGLFVLGAGLLLAAAIVLPLLGAGPVGGVWIAAVLALVPVFLLIALVVGVVYAFTTAFVVPIMILEDCGVLAGWRRLWPTVTDEWKQYLAYAVVGFLLTLVGGIVVAVATGVLALLLLLPFGILFVLGVGLFALVSPLVGVPVLAVVGLAFVLAIVAVAALVQVPVQAYLRYYALLVLGDVEPEFDLIPDRRAAARESSDGPSSPPSEDASS